MININELDNLEFTDKELEDFYSNFDYNFLEYFDLILYFAQFDYDMKELIDNLKKVKEKVLEKKMWNYTKRDIDKVVMNLKNKEVELLYRLCDSAETCSKADGRYEEYRSYFDDLIMVSIFELEKRDNHNIIKKLVK